MEKIYIIMHTLANVGQAPFFKEPLVVLKTFEKANMYLDGIKDDICNAELVEDTTDLKKMEKRVVSYTYIGSFDNSKIFGQYIIKEFKVF